MQTHIIQIGNSLGVRLPKAVLDGLGLERSSALTIQADAQGIILKPARAPRAGWAQAFAADAGPAEDLWGDLPVDESWDR